MITPNKTVTLKESALGAAAIIMEYGPGTVDLLELYKKSIKNLESADQFLLAIDILYVLGRIQINFEARTVSYVD